MKKALSIILGIALIMSFVLQAAAISIVPVKSIQLNKNEVFLSVDQTFNLKATLTPKNTTQRLLTYVTGNKKIATVNKDGLITAIGAGSTAINVYTSNNKIFATCKVNVAKKYKISYATWADAPSSYNNYVVNELNKKYNIELDLQWYERANYADQLNIRLAGGDIPDFWIPSDSGIGAFNQRFLASFSMEMIKKNMPEYFKASLAYGEAYKCQVWARGLFDNKNLKAHYVFPALQYASITPMAVVIRKDWLENVGIKNPPTTLEEWEEMMVKFVNGDPDKNGKKDTFGMTIRGKDAIQQAALFVFGAHGTTPQGFMQDINGYPVDPVLNPGFKDALQTLNDWYNKGLIDKEFLTTDWARVQSLSANNRLGVIDMATWYRYYSSQSDINNSIKNIPGASFIYVKPPVGVNGYYGLNKGIPSFVGYVFGVQLKRDPAKFERVLQLINGMLTDPDTYKTLWGKEGVNYDINAEGAIYKPEFDTPEKRKDIGSNAFQAMRVFAPPAVQMIMQYKNAVYEEVVEKSGTNIKYFNDSGVYVATDDKNKDKKMNDIGWTIDQIEKRWMVGFITGEKSIDKDWNTFMNELKDAGFDERVKYVNENSKKISSILNVVNSQVSSLK